MTSRPAWWLGRIAGGLVAAAFALPVQAAGVSASAIVDLTGLTISGNGVTFSAGQPVSTADVDADLTGFPSANLTGATSSDTLDLAPVCVGACPQIGSNVFPVLSGPPVANFSTSDQVRTGSLLTGARIGSGAYTYLNAGLNTASADSNNNLNGTFTVTTAGPVTVAFDARAYFHAYASASEAFPSFATGAYQVTISILNVSAGGTTVFAWSPNGAAGGIFGGSEIQDPFTLNSTVSLNAPVPADTTNPGVHTPNVASSGRFSATTNALQPGTLYQLSIRVLAGADAQRVVPALLGDRLWEDRNGNGLQDCTDTNGNGIIGDMGDTGPECNAGVPNATVNLRTPDGGGNCVGGILATTTTDSQGFYQFNNLSAGTYCVEFVPSAGYCPAGNPVFTMANVGANDAIDSDAGANGRTGPVTLALGDVNRTVDAGIYCPASLGDFVWNDTNQNGIQDAGEPGIGGVQVKLYACDGTELMTTTTDANGLYHFGGLKPGSYFVAFTKPSGFEFTLQNAGGDTAKDSDANPANGTTACVTLASGEHNPTIDAGLFQPQVAELCVGSGKTKVKPTELDLQYTGGTCASSNNSQSKFACTDFSGGPQMTQPVRILFTDKSSPTDSKALVFLDQSGVMLNQTVTAKASNAKQTNFKADSYIHIFSGSTLRETVKMHTSCSQPLIPGEQFGAIKLTGGK
jgi:hypothetical protein